MKEIWVVKHYEGIDGDHIVTAFSDEYKAQYLCEMYNSTVKNYTYDEYWTHKVVVDEFDITDYQIVTDPYNKDYKELINTKEVSMEEWLRQQTYSEEDDFEDDFKD